MNEQNFLYPDPPESLLRLRTRDLVSWIGPGFIIASVTIGSGELVWASRGGAIFGYAMLWCFLYAGIFKGIQVYTAARHITLTGEHPMVGWARPTWMPVLPLLIAVPAVLLMPVAFSAIPEILGGFLSRMSGMTISNLSPAVWSHQEFQINAWTTAVMIVCVLLALASNYRVFERVSAVVVGAIVCSVAFAVFWLGPDLRQLLSGLFVPRVDEFPEWLVTNPDYAAEFSGRSPWLEVSLYLSAVGGGAFDYIGYIGMIREKKWGLAGRRIASRQELAIAVDPSNMDAMTTLHRARLWTRAPLIDALLSFAMVIVVTLLFAILGTLILNSSHTIPANNQLLIHQEQFLVALHPELKWLYRTGVLLAFLGTLYGAYEVYQYTFAESAHAIVPRTDNATTTRRLRRLTVGWCFFGGLTMIWLPQSMAGSVVDRMTFGSIISGAATCGVWCFAMIWLDYVRLPPPLRMSWTLRVVTAVAGTAMLILGIQSGLAYFTPS